MRSAVSWFVRWSRVSRIVATPLAWWLARSKSQWKEVVATVVSLPMVLPATVLGF